METNHNATNGTARAKASDLQPFQPIAAHMQAGGSAARRDVILAIARKGTDELHRLQGFISRYSSFDAARETYRAKGLSEHQVIREHGRCLANLKRKADELQYQSWRLEKLAKHEGLDAPEIEEMRRFSVALLATISTLVTNWASEEVRRIRELELSNLGFVTLTRALIDHLEFDPLAKKKRKRSAEVVDADGVVDADVPIAEVTR